LHGSFQIKTGSSITILKCYFHFVDKHHSRTENRERFWSVFNLITLFNKSNNDLKIVGFALLVFFCSIPLEAYVGPGAGFAFVSTFFVFLATFFLVLLTLLIWPIRFVYRLVTGKFRKSAENIDRMIIIGFDGMEPSLCDKWMDEGKLPNLKKLAELGSYKPLSSTFPSISPVAWSTFSTGVNPAKHNIYDFLTRDKNTYLPELSSAKIGSSSRTLKLGSFTIPLGKPEIRLLRKSKTFWKILGEHGIFSHILRVPISFPPEKFNGLSVAAMCVPDLVGSQGTFSYYTSEPSAHSHTGGVQIPVEVENGELLLQNKTILLEKGKYTEWIKIAFKPFLWIKVHGICRFLLKETEPYFKLYVTPLNIDPEKPALPITHPTVYSVYLSKLIGPYSTLGLAEDTWALNEGIINDGDFLEQCYSIHEERKKMFFNALERTRKGVCAVVFDATDRIQHMFFRYLDPDHPAIRGKEPSPHKDAIEELYKKCDKLVGQVLDTMNDKDVLMIMSDHGFKIFSRGINLNSWLHQNGYLTLKDNDKATSDEWFENVNWKKTKAYNLGLGGIFLNVKGRESQGIVDPDETAPLKDELVQKLSGLTDPENNKIGIKAVYDTAKIYNGPYLVNAPDLIIGYGDGYRASWDGVTGIINDIT